MRAHCQLQSKRRSHAQQGLVLGWYALHQTSMQMRGGPPARDGSRIRHRARGPVGNGPPARDDSLNCPAQAVARLHRQHLSRPQHRAPDRCDVPLRARTRLRIRVHPAAARRRGGVAYNRTSTRPRARGQEDAFERPRKRHRPFGSERIAHQDGKGDGHQATAQGAPAPG